MGENLHDDDIAPMIQRLLAEMRASVPFDSASVQELRGGRLVIVGGIGFADLDVIIGESFDVDNADSASSFPILRNTAPFAADCMSAPASAPG